MRVVPKFAFALTRYNKASEAKSAPRLHRTRARVWHSRAMVNVDGKWRDAGYNIPHAVVETVCGHIPARPIVDPSPLLRECRLCFPLLTKSEKRALRGLPLACALGQHIWSERADADGPYRTCACGEIEVP